jgi:hypothetical protein
MKWAQRAIAIAAVGLAALAIERGWWFLDSGPRPISTFDDPSVWQYLFADRTMLGFARLAILALAVYLIASVPALIIGGRWLKAIGAGGASADDAEQARDVVQSQRAEIERLTTELKTATEKVDELTSERDSAVRLVRRLVRASRSSPTRPGVVPIVREEPSGEEEDPAERDDS